MYVCVCKSVTDREIVDHVQSGVGCFDELQFETGVGSCCGRCADTARAIVADTLASRSGAAGDAGAGGATVALARPHGQDHPHGHGHGGACGQHAGAECACAAAVATVSAAGPVSTVTRPPVASRRVPISARSV